MFGRRRERELMRLLEQERKQHRLEISVLLDRLADLSGKPWTLPPRPVEPLTPRTDPITEEYGDLEEL